MIRMLKERSRLVSFKLPERLDEKFEFLKLKKGGFTAWVIAELEKVEVDHELLAKLKELQ